MKQKFDRTAWAERDRQYTKIYRAQCEVVHMDVQDEKNQKQIDWVSSFCVRGKLSAFGGTQVIDVMDRAGFDAMLSFVSGLVLGGAINFYDAKALVEGMPE